MRYLIAVLLSVFTVTLTAQITITSSDLPQAGQSYTIQTSLPDPLSDFTTTGVGFDWDFSNLISNSEAEVEFGAMEDAPVLAQLSFNNQWTNAEYLCDVFGPGEFDLAALETIGIELPVAISNLYSYLQTSNDSYNIAGISMSLEGLVLPVEYSDIDEIHPLPLNYMDEIYSTSAFTINIPEEFTYDTSASREGSVDGWGILTLPGGATHEVLRINTTITTHEIFSLPGSDPFEIDRVSTVYSWIGDGGMPYLEVSMIFGTVFSVEYQGDDSCVDIDEDGVCDIFEVLGCMDTTACNYNPDVTIDDGSCVYDLDLDFEIIGSISPEEFTSGTYAVSPYLENSVYTWMIDGGVEISSIGGQLNVLFASSGMGSVYCEQSQGTCINSSDFPLVIFPNGYIICLDDDDAVSAVGGCINAVDVLGCDFYWNDMLISELCPESCNNCPCDNDFNDNGIYDNFEVFGCTYPDAVNYDSLATADNGSCEYDEISSDCPSDINGDGLVTTQDLLVFLSFFGEICE